MAKVGGGAAYSKLRDLDNSVNQGLQFWGQQEAARQENEKLRQERESIRKEKADADFASAYGSLEEFKQKVTGYNTYDEIGADFTNKAREAYVEQYKIAQRARETGDKQKLIEAEMNMKKIKGSFSQVVDINTTLAKRNEEYVKMVQDGTMGEVDADDWEAQNESLIRDKNFVIEFDKSYNPLIVGLQKDGSKEMVSDEKGGLKPYTLDYKSVINGDWRPYRRVELTGKGGIVDGILSNLGSYEEKKNKGLYTINSKLWNPQIEEAARVHIKASLDNETMAGLLYRIKGIKKKKDFTPDERKLVEDELLKAVEGGYTQKYQEEFNKDYGNYTVELKKANETERSNKADEAIARRNSNIAAYVAKTGRITAEAEINNGAKKESKNIVNASAIFKTNKGNSYRTYSLSNIDEKGNQIPTPFVAGVDEEGKPVHVSSVDIDTKTGSFRYKDNKGVLKTLSYKDDPNLYNTLYSQILGREEVDYSAPSMTQQSSGTSR